MNYCTRVEAGGGVCGGVCGVKSCEVFGIFRSLLQQKESSCFNARFVFYVHAPPSGNTPVGCYGLLFLPFTWEEGAVRLLLNASLLQG